MSFQANLCENLHVNVQHFLPMLWTLPLLLPLVLLLPREEKEVNMFGGSLKMELLKGRIPSPTLPTKKCCSCFKLGRPLVLHRRVAALYF
jgi:hypothetical protein